MNKEFDNMTHLGQARKLRQLAIEVLKSYPLKNYQLKFIYHGENTTFKVTHKKKDYLLRIHCRSHRTKQAMQEELKWLEKLSHKTDIPVQQPLRSESNQLITTLGQDIIGHERHCDLLNWQPGRILNNKNPNIFYKVGQLTGKLQANSMVAKHRNYWDTEGLLGKQATLGSLSCLKAEFPKQYAKIEPLRQELFKQLKKYEQQNPRRKSLIHADLHFGNMVWEKGVVKPIDFDDCGVGLEMYDLAVTLAQSSNYFKRVGKKQAREAKEALLKGYAESKDFTEKDRQILPYIVATRGLAMLGWLWGRRDNPMLYQHLKKNINSYITKTNQLLKQANQQNYY